jgi:hypothetical protein
MDCAVYGQNPRMIELLTPHTRDEWNLVYTGQTKRVQEVLREKPDLAKVVWDGWTPLMGLPDDEGRAVEIVTPFLAHGADPSIRNKEGLTAKGSPRQTMHASARSTTQPISRTPPPAPAINLRLP